MNWKSKKVLITGAGGFIGSHLTERIVNLGAETRAFVHYNSMNTWGWLDYSTVKSDIKVYSGDIADRDSIKRAFQGVDVVFHLAALIGIPYSYHAPSSYVRTNINGSLNMFREALESDVDRIVHTSTSEVYGSAKYVPIDEDHPLQGQSPYSASKIGAEKLAEAFYLSFDLPVVTLRPFNTYGPRQSNRAVIPTIVTQCIKNNSIDLGNVSPSRDFNYISDTVEGFIRAAESSKAIGHVINIGSGSEISIGELAKRIAHLMDKEIEIKIMSERKRPEKGEVDRLCAANDLAQKILNWEPKTPLDKGLMLTINWIKDNYEKYKSEEYTI